MYRDYAINREMSPLGSAVDTRRLTSLRVRRWIEHKERDGSILLFVREKKTLGSLQPPPFTFLGPVTYADHRGERPVAFTWKLPEQMPEELFEVARSVAAAYTVPSTPTRRRPLSVPTTPVDAAEHAAFPRCVSRSRRS